LSDFAALKNNVSKELGLDETASGTEDVLLGRRLNEAVRYLLVKTQCYVKTATITLAANDYEYELTDALSDDALVLLQLITSDGKLCERVTVQELYGFREASPAVANAYTYRYALAGANLLLLYPTPSAAGTLTALYVPKPTEMSSGTHDPATATYGNIPVQWHDAIELYAMSKLASFDDDASSQMGAVYKVQLDTRLKEIRGEIRRLGGKMPRAKVGRRYLIPSDPSRT
jgi:hypothetical protein